MSEQKSATAPKTKVQIIGGGPLMLEGEVTIVDKNGVETVKEGKVFLCRCGVSKTKPFCDGTHKTVEFDK
jgi:CDGSH-type Zn-finger protein